MASAPSGRKRLTTALVWGLFLLALGTCVALVALSSMESRPPVNKARLLLNPRDIDIHLVNGNSCANWSSQHSYAVRTGQPDHHLAEHLLDLYGA
ncbi:DNA-binding transcriptional activator CadC [Klebsiella pneumoniae]|uniref:DNA-binding transcriptional activator CadC n=1 Tax=Klebsiella pneumoniae TaxID=573 RepID=A0A2X3EE92_KLEPN|nr:DNA-binding transcriptional activator CadC [Klebsiella pneumoniae]